MALVQKSFSEIITFSRASNATRFAPDGVLQYAPHNLLLQSQTFQTTWANERSSEQTDVIISPAGTLTGDKLVEDTTATNSHLILQGVSGLATGSTLTFSVYIKAAERTSARLQINDGTSLANAVFANYDVSTGVASATQSIGTFTGASSTITPVGNGWYRCSISGVATGVTAVQCRIFLMIGGSTFYTGNGTSGIYIWGAQLAVGPYPLDYTPTTTAVVYGPRFDYNPTTLAPLGLLIEEQRTNLLLYSEQFDNAGWTKTRSSITANAIVSPNGTLDADKLISDTTAGQSHYIAQTVAQTGAHTLSIYAKQGEVSGFLLWGIGASSFAAGFNLALGTTYLEAISGVVPPDLGTNIVDVGNGWFRCSISFTANAGTSVRIVLDKDLNGDASYTGDGVSGIYIWGAQLEAGAFPTSYIPTVASTVTRSADVASINTLSPWYNAAEGTLVLRGIYRYIASGSPGFLRFDNGTDNERMMFAIASGTQRFTVIDGGTEVVDISRSGVVAETAFTHSAAYKVNDFAACVNGGVVGTDTVGTLPTVTQAIFRRSLSSDYPNGWLQRIAYYNRRLTDAELQVLTS